MGLRDNFYKKPVDEECKFGFDEKTNDYHGCFINEDGNWVLCERHFKQVIYEITGKHWSDIHDGA